MFVHTNGKLTNDKINAYENSRQAFLFITGTGLEIMLENYCLGYDAQNIREIFYKKFHIHET